MRLKLMMNFNIYNKFIHFIFTPYKLSHKSFFISFFVKSKNFFQFRFLFTSEFIEYSSRIMMGEIKCVVFFHIEPLNFPIKKF